VAAVAAHRAASLKEVTDEAREGLFVQGVEAAG
jgi:hypothetical protein